MKTIENLGYAYMDHPGLVSANILFNWRKAHPEYTADTYYEPYREYEEELERKARRGYANDFRSRYFGELRHKQKLQDAKDLIKKQSDDDREAQRQHTEQLKAEIKEKHRIEALKRR